MPKTCGTCCRRTERGACLLYLSHAYVDCDWWEPVAPEEDQEMTGAELIAAERKRQIEEEGWTAEHDDTHKQGELLRAALTYARHADYQVRFAFSPEGPFNPWPWDRKWWKPDKDPMRNLAKAGALIAAEIDRLARKATP